MDTGRRVKDSTAHRPMLLTMQTTRPHPPSPSNMFVRVRMPKLPKGSPRALWEEAERCQVSTQRRDERPAVHIYVCGCRLISILLTMNLSLCLFVSLSTCIYWNMFTFTQQVRTASKCSSLRSGRLGSRQNPELAKMRPFVTVAVAVAAVAVCCGCCCCRCCLCRCCCCRCS